MTTPWLAGEGREDVELGAGQVHALPSTRAMRVAGSTSRPGAADAVDRARRGIARIRATSSRGLNGLVR